MQSEQLEKWLQQLEVSTLLTTICEKQTETTRIVQESLTRFLAWRKMSKRLFIGSSEFFHSDYIMQQKNGYYTYLVIEFIARFLCWAKHQKHPQSEIGSP